MSGKWNFKLIIIGFFLTIPGPLLAGSDPLQTLEDARKNLVKKIAPSVVAILIESPHPERSSTLMSGVVIDDKGHIVTFGKFFDPKEQLSVLTNQKEKFLAKVKAFDPLSRISLLKVSEKAKLPPLPWADSDRAERGDLVVTIGNPFGLLGSVSFGNISGTQRIVELGENIFPRVLQITAPINPGDTGGLVANREGKILGLMATSYHNAYQDHDLELMKRMLKKLLQDPKGAERWLPLGAMKRNYRGCGIGFVLPGNFVRRVAQNLLEKGTMQWGRLGLKAVSRQEKIVVNQVLPRSPAQKGGLKEGDVILKYNQNAVESLYQFKTLILFSEPGKKATIVVERKGVQMELHPVIGFFAMKK